MNILFVCSGNTCRSAMAWGIARDIIQKNPEKYRHLKVASAGTYGRDGDKASENAVLACQKHGIDLSGFTATQVTPALLNDADLVLAMTGSHKKLLNALSPQAMDKIFLLKEYEYGENVNELNMRLGQLFEAYGAARENFVKGNQENLAELDRLNKVDPKKAEALFHKLNNELAQGVKAMDEEINAIDEKLKSMEIPDPFGGDLAEYEACYDVLAKSIANIFAKLTKEEC